MNEVDEKLLIDLLNESKNITINTCLNQKNFLSVSGYPHYENVMSNILSFFFNTSEEHKFKDLWIKSLLQCYYQNDYIEDQYFTEDINREYQTESDKRIDILMKTNKNIIVIENKINSGVDNPFDEYHNAAVKKYGDENLIEILLTLYKENDIKKDNFCFKNITYDILIQKIKSNVGDYICEINEKWLVFMNEVIKNIQSLYEEENMCLDEKWQKFLEDNDESLNNFLDNYLNDLGAKANIFNDIKDKLICKYDKKIVDVIGTYGMTNTIGRKTYMSLFINIKNKNDDIMTLEPYIYKDRPNCLYIVLHVLGKEKKSYSYKEEKAIFENSEVKSDGGWGQVLKIREYYFSREKTDINSLMKIFEDIINKLIKLYK